MMNNKKMLLINDDCFNALKDIPDNSIDLILTDPPYNIAPYSTGNIKFDWRSDINNDVAEWDLEPLKPEYLINEFKRILKPKGNIFIFCSYNIIGDAKTKNKSTSAKKKKIFQKRRKRRFSATRVSEIKRAFPRQAEPRRRFDVPNVSARRRNPDGVSISTPPSPRQADSGRRASKTVPDRPIFPAFFAAAQRTSPSGRRRLNAVPRSRRFRRRLKFVLARLLGRARDEYATPSSFLARRLPP